MKMWALLHQMLGCYFLEVFVGQSRRTLWLTQSLLLNCDSRLTEVSVGNSGLCVGIIFTHPVSTSRTWECTISGLR